MLVIEGEAVLDLGIAFEDCKEHFDTRNGAETVAKAPMYRLQGKSSMWVPAGKMLLLVPSDKQSAGEEQVENNEQDNVFGLPMWILNAPDKDTLMSLPMNLRKALATWVGGHLSRKAGESAWKERAEAWGPVFEAMEAGQ